MDGQIQADKACRNFRRLLGLMAAEEVLALRTNEDGYSRFFGGTAPDFDQDWAEQNQEIIFCRHFEACFDCRQRYQTVNVYSLGPEWFNRAILDDQIII